MDVFVDNCKFVNSSGSNNVSAYTMYGTTGALTPVAGSPFPAGSYPASVTVDATGQFAYVANLYSNNVSAYTIDRTTGAMTPVATSALPAGPMPSSASNTARPQAPPASTTASRKA